MGRWIQDRQELILGGIPYAGIQDNVRHGDGDFIWKRNHTHTAVSCRDDPAPVFTVILTIAVYLLASLISKNILQVTDIGTDDFFNSGYYTKCMEQKCSELTDYLHLLQKGNKRSAEDDKRYLQYTNEFKREDTNFCYWYKQNGVWYTNQPDSVEGQEFDTQTVLMEQRPWGII